MANSSDYYYNKGLNFINEGNYDEALMYIDKAIEMDKESPDYWFSKVKCLTELEMYSDALKCFDDAIKFNPDDDLIKVNKVDLLCKYANKLSDAGKFKEPLKLYDEAISLIPGDEKIKYKKVKLLCNHANDLVNKDKFKEPLKLFDEAIKLVPNDETVKSYKVNLLTKHANKLFEEEEFEKSSKYWDKIIKVDSDNPSHHYNKAILILKESDFKHWEITEYMIKTRLITKDMILARRLVDIKNFTQAIDFLNKTDTIEYDMNLSELSRKATLLFNCGCIDESIQCLDESLLLLKNEKESFGESFVKQKEFELLNRKADFLNHKSLTFDTNCQYEDANKCLDEAIRILPEHNELYYLILKNKGRNFLKLFQFEEARKCFDESYNILNDLESLYLYINASISLKQFEEASEDVDFLIDSEPDNIFYISEKIRLLFLTNEIDSAIELCEQIIEKNPKLSNKLKSKINNLNKIKTIRKALNEVNKSLELDGDNNEVLSFKNKLELEEVMQIINIDGLYALDCFNELCIDENNVDYLFCKSKIFLVLNNHIKCDEYLKKALEIID